MENEIFEKWYNIIVDMFNKLLLLLYFGIKELIGLEVLVLFFLMVLIE